MVASTAQRVTATLTLQGEKHAFDVPVDGMPILTRCAVCNTVHNLTAAFLAACTCACGAFSPKIANLRRYTHPYSDASGNSMSHIDPVESRACPDVQTPFWRLLKHSRDKP